MVSNFQKYKNLTKEQMVALIELGFDFKVLTQKMKCTEMEPALKSAIVPASKNVDFPAESAVVPTSEEGKCISDNERTAFQAKKLETSVEV